MSMHLVGTKRGEKAKRKRMKREEEHWASLAGPVEVRTIDTPIADEELDGLGSE